MSAYTPVALIMAGGTGGHIMPGLAVADVLRARGWTVRWLGNPDKMEGKLVPAAGYTMATLRFAGFRGKGILAKLQAPFLLMRALVQAWKQFSTIRPDVVLGMGGYVAFPGGVVSALRATPLVLHEQNAVVGMANRWLARVARRVLTGFPKVLAKAEVVGNPVRQDVAALAEPQSRYNARSGALRVLVLGGSLGATALNVLLPQALAKMPQAHRPSVTHQAGAQHLDTLVAAYLQAGVHANCVPFIENIAQALSEADLLICRAGAMTVAEVAAAGVAALFIPYPHAVDDHQSANARFLSHDRAAWLMQQKEITPDSLSQWLLERSRAELSGVAQRARLHARPHAATRIADICEELAGVSA
jgi:UDP-N-acetylglucosamine--N-acetylmuramyl-(pentapeptide) pyrophosphoryl-undecaprenol N-acetylglucosamine transferase